MRTPATRILHTWTRPTHSSHACLHMHSVRLLEVNSFLQDLFLILSYFWEERWVWLRLQNRLFLLGEFLDTPRLEYAKVKPTEKERGAQSRSRGGVWRQRNRRAAAQQKPFFFLITILLKFFRVTIYSTFCDEISWCQIKPNSALPLLKLKTKTHTDGYEMADKEWNIMLCFAILDKWELWDNKDAVS